MDYVSIMVNAIVSIVSVFGGILTANKLVIYRIEQLEKKVEKHNEVVRRTYELETHEEVTDEKIKVINHRIEDLEAYHK